MQAYTAVRARLQKAVQAMSNDLPEMRPACVSLHRDLDIETTPVSDETRDQMREAVSQQFGIDLETLDATDIADLEVDYSLEHHALHYDLTAITQAFLNSRRVQTPDDLVALAFAAGRRYGMIEAGEAMTLGDDRIPGDLL